MMEVVNINTSSDPKGSSVNGLEESASDVMFFIRDEVTNKVGGNGETYRTLENPPQDRQPAQTSLSKQLDSLCNLHRYVLKGFVVELQAIGDQPILLQVARLLDAERSVGGGTDENQVLRSSCEMSDILSRSLCFIESRCVITWCSVGAASTKRKGLHRLGKYRKAAVNGH